MALIELQKISKVYDMGRDIRTVALNEVSLQIEAGEFVAIMGASGSGKSTLMHILGFLDTPTAGRYIYNNQLLEDLDENSLAQIRNREVGFVFQAFNLLPRTTALENVKLPMIYAKIEAREQDRRGNKALSEVGLTDRGHHQPNELSGGQQQRVSIARALVNEPKIIFADEPTGNLDSKSSYEIMAIFHRLNDEGKTIIMVTHEEDIAAYARRIIRLRDGQVVEDQAVKGRIIPPGEHS
jgi:putative ABC transport system ATP-binding protein